MQWLLLITVSGMTFAQTTVERTVISGLGDPLPTPNIVTTGNTATERIRSINGRTVPLERVEERVIKSDDSGRVVERIRRLYGPNGNLSETVKTVEEEQKLANGGSIVRASTYRTDVNGNLQPVERTSTRTDVSGDSKTLNTTVERPSINGGFQLAEKRETSENPAASNTIVYRTGENGGMYEALRETAVRTHDAGGAIVENAAQYAVGTSGKLELAQQTVTRTLKQPDGRESTTVDILRPQQLKQQKVVERRPIAGGFEEVVSLRQATLANPDRLGAPRVVRETTCRGKCDK